MSLQLLENECIICFESIKPTDLVGKIPCCPTKIYHKDCITIWSSKSNSCPTCRNNFYQVQITSARDLITILEVLKVQDKLLPNAAIDRIPSQYIIPQSNVDQQYHTQTSSLSLSTTTFCCICTVSNRRYNNQTILCFQCGSSFHLNCLGVQQEIDDYTLLWFCPMCDYSQETLLPRSNRGIRYGYDSNSGHGNSMVGLRSRSVIADLIRPRALQRSNPGLVIFNENNELDDAFLYEEEENGEDDSMVDYDNNGDGTLVVNNNSVNSDLHAEIPNSRLLQTLLRLHSQLLLPLRNFSHSSHSSHSSHQHRQHHQLSRTMNGGKLLRREQKQEELLTPEEADSWKTFQKARELTLIEASLGMEPQAISSNPGTSSSSFASNSFLVSRTPLQSNVTTRKKRRKQLSSKSDAGISTHHVKPLANQPSRITNLINELKTGKKSETKNTTYNNKHDRHLYYQHQSYHPSMVSNSGSTSFDSPSYSESNSNLSSLVNSPSPLEASSYSSSDDNEYTPQHKRELTYDQKSIIQKYLRHKLKDRYKPETAIKRNYGNDHHSRKNNYDDNDDDNYNHNLNNSSNNISGNGDSGGHISNCDYITNEEQFIKINKTISRKIYTHIVNSTSLDDIEEYFKDADKLKNLIDLYIVY